MNNLSNEQEVTVKEFARILDVSVDTIKRSIRKLYLNKMQHGITTSGK